MKRILAVLIGLAAAGSLPADAKLTARDLRCEYRANPMGIDIAHPRLSWIVVSPRRSERQTAWQVLAATTRKRLDDGVGDLWDSGRVESDETAHIPYNGVALASGQECWWKVRCWDRDGAPGPWSEPARWTAGLLKPSDWSARWIAAPPPPGKESEAHPLAGLEWVWMPGENAREGAPGGTRRFRKQIEIPADKPVKSAVFSLTADNGFTLFINGDEVARDDRQTDAWKRVVSADIADRLAPGVNVLAVEAFNESGAAGLIGRLDVRFESGDSLSVPINASWNASTETPDGWTRAGFDDSAWPAAEVVAKVGDSPWGIPGRQGLVLPPSPYLRTTFRVAKPVKRATLYATALGLYEAHLNGRKVGNDVFRPGWTDYKTRLYYQTYDVTGLLKQGENALGAVLAEGWALGYVGFGGRDRYGIDRPRVRLQMKVEYEDGTSETVGTDERWTAAYGPILEGDLQMGETYDARAEMPGWDTTGYSAADWKSVETPEDWPAPLQAEPGVPVREVMEIPAKTISEPSPSGFVFDLGQNMVGWARLKVSGPAGTKVTLRFAEMLNPDGTIYTTNLRSARATDTYTLRGGGTETWEPRFTFHGFRYVEVTGYPGKPGLGAVTGVVAHSDTPLAGTFECSDPAINQLQHNIQWGQRGNFLEVPTDCPQRDERLGWMGDAQVFIRTATHNMDVSAFFTKWMVDVVDAQTPDGAFTDIAPNLGLGAGTAAWADAGVIVPWTMYEVYGDTPLLRRHYDAMARYITYLEEHSEGLLRPAEGYGDWLSINAETPKDVLATACFAGSASLMARIARVLGKDADAERYAALHRRVAEAFCKAYVTPDGKVRGETQTVYVLALYWDLLPEAQRPKALQFLVDDIESRGWRLSTGFVGTPLLLPTLTRFGRNDVAYRLFRQEEFPSWLFSVRHGATTIWERWDGWTPDKGFQDPGMNSFNHYAFGAVGAWMAANVAGIDAEEPGFRRILIRPRPGGGLGHASAEYDSIRGRIASSWKQEKDGFRMDVTIPANTTATVHVPAANPESVTEGGKPAADAQGLRFLRMEDGAAVYEAGSGTYRFRVQPKD